MGKYLTKTGLAKYTTKLKEYISKAKVASAASADNAIKVNNHTVDTDVPANAKFTDTDTWRPQPDWNATSGDAAIKNKPASMPASDVPNWAKQETKPTYTASEIGLGNVGNFKAVSTVANQGLTDTEKSNARANIGAGTSSFSGSYNDLSNKPTIPSVGNGTVTIKQAGTSKGTFTMNQSGNTTIELTDNNTTYGVATSSALGLIKSGTDITVDSSGNVSVNDDSHNHVISNIDGLQSALDSKASSSHTHTKSEVGLGNVDNTADADKSVKYAATAGSANSVAWSNVSGKPTLGNAASKTTRGLNGIGTCGWVGGEIDKDYVPDMTFMAWWNGAYSETASNLTYCNKGAFGTAATANKGDFAPASHTHNYLPLSGGVIKDNFSDITINPGELVIRSEDGTVSINGLGISDSGSDCWHQLKGVLQVGQIETIDGSPIIDIRNGTTNEGHVWSAVILRDVYDRYAYCIMNIRMKLQLGGLWMTLPFNFANSDYNVTVSRKFDSYCRVVSKDIASLTQYVDKSTNFFRINTSGTGDTMYNAYNYGESDDAFFVTITGEVPY